jgi:hypothetical protein
MLWSSRRPVEEPIVIQYCAAAVPATKDTPLRCRRMLMISSGGREADEREAGGKAAALFPVSTPGLEHVDVRPRLKRR